MRVAVIGLGSAGGRHARLLAELGHEIAGHDPQASPPDGVEAAASVADALTGADAAVIASPSSLHVEHALAAIESRVPTLIEKPLAADATGARIVADAAAQAGIVCGLAMNLRFHAGPMALRRLIDQGDLGRLLFARASFGHDLRLWRPGTDYRLAYSARAELGGGILLDAIHEVDELLWLLGPARSVSAQLAHVSDLEIDVEDVALATVAFESGALGTFDLNFIDPSYRRTCLLVGENGVADWDWTRGSVIVRDAEGGVTEMPGATEPVDTYRAELSDFLAAVDGRGTPRTTLADGVSAMELVDAAKRSSAEGARVDLPA
jgi:predicted dehydrogenase